jgi:hypothetical protein
MLQYSQVRARADLLRAGFVRVDSIHPGLIAHARHRWLASLWNRTTATL